MMHGQKNIKSLHIVLHYELLSRYLIISMLSRFSFSEAEKEHVCNFRSYEQWRS